MKKIVTLILIALGVLLLTGCTEPKETETPCGNTMVLVEGMCIPKESFCSDTQKYENDECVEITCDVGEVIVDRECQVPVVTCNPYEDLVNGNCVDTYNCNANPNSETCLLISETAACVAGGNIMIDGSCYGDNQTCGVDQELRNSVCVDLTACEIDSNSTACALETAELACVATGDNWVNGACEVKAVDCEVTPNLPECLVVEKNFLDIYYLNDFHGAILEDGNDQIGIANIANLILTKKENNPDNTLFITGGDILQGSALSNYFIGESTIELLDLSQLDAFILGNHEFDWGLEEITKYFDEIEENGEADFPLLAANVFYKGTTDIPEFIEPYTIVEKGDLKIGIIGAIGATLESSIATSKVEDYEFVYALPLIEEYATYLRGTEDCDIVLVVAHDSGGINNAVANLTGLARIDAVFNGHSHSNYIEGTTIPFIQSGSYGEYVGYVRLNLDANDTVISWEAENLDYNDDPLLLTADSEVQDLVDFYWDATGGIFNINILTAAEYLSTYDLSVWVTHVIVDATGADIAFQNHSGGTRRSISNGSDITLGVLYEVWPFDNIIKTVLLPGSVVKDLINGGNAYYTEVANFEDDTLYKVATNDYLFDKVNNPYLSGDEITITDFYLRDLAFEELTLQALIYSVFNLDNEIQINKSTE